MSLLPVVSGQVALDSTATSASDVFNGGIRFAQAGQAKCTTDVGTFFNQGIPMTADGAVSVVDATAGLPAGTTFPSGLPISGNRLCVSSNAVSVTANGITFDAAGAVAATGFAPSIVSDPYFEYVSLLANTTSTNGAQNNTFLDGSTNAFSITRNGNTTQGNFSPFSQTGWSNYFDGTGDFLTLASNAAFGLGTGDFTIEMWVYATANPANGPGNIFDLRTGVTATAAACRVNSSLNVLFYDGPSNIEINVGTIQLNTWTHIAHVRASGSLKTYINGTISNTTTVTSDLGTNQPCMIGNNQTAGFAWNGYQSNFRIVKGTAVYTANFTPPTTPLTAITNTSLLTCQSNRFIDNSSNAFAITRNGDVSVQAFSPFNPTAAWSAGTNGGSGYFDGTGDYLTVPTNAAFDFGSGNFTVEFWFYSNIANSSFQRVFGISSGGAVSTESVFFEIDAAGIYMAAVNGTTLYGATTQTALRQNTWNHLALVRNGNTVTGYINGVSVGSSTMTVAVNFATGAFPHIGAWNQSGVYSRFINGYIADLRIVKGTAVYTAAFTPPTAPLTAITNTSLLLNFTNAGIYDSASGNDLETVGNAQVSTTQAKFGTTSMGFDGTGDWIPKADRPPLRLGTADFTIEGWVYLNAAGVAYGLISKGAASTGWSVNVTSGNKLQFSYTATQLTGATSLAASTWYHFAVVRSGSASGNLKVYLNGTADATSAGAVTDNFNQTDIMYVGADRVAGSSLNGYIDDLRITNGYARYTANFTPPTAAFPLN